MRFRLWYVWPLNVASFKVARIIRQCSVPDRRKEKARGKAPNKMRRVWVGSGEVFFLQTELRSRSYKATNILQLRKIRVCVKSNRVIQDTVITHSCSIHLQFNVTLFHEVQISFRIYLYGSRYSDGLEGEVRFPAGTINFSLLRSYQSGSGVHSASYPMGAGKSFPRV
jgi:hypothetical protein